jgi:hypothetical protein
MGIRSLNLEKRFLESKVNKCGLSRCMGACYKKLIEESLFKTWFIVFLHFPLETGSAICLGK